MDSRYLLARYGNPYLQVQFSTRTLLLAIVTVAALVTLFKEEAGPRNHFGVFSPHYSALMAAIYFWKFMIIRSGFNRYVRQTAYIVLLMATLPFLYWQC